MYTFRGENIHTLIFMLITLSSISELHFRKLPA